MVTVGGKNFWTAHAFGKDSEFDAVFATKFDSCDYRMLNGGNHNQNSMGSMGRYTNPLKEFLKHSMLQHEAIFKEQVYELHRLYWTQKNLMNTHNLKENCTAWDMGPQLSSVSLQNERRDSQSEGVNFIPPLNPMMSTVQADNRIMVEHCQGSSSTLHQSRRRRVAIDLELPGEDYISDDEFTKDQKQGEVQNPAQHEMMVLPENMKCQEELRGEAEIPSCQMTEMSVEKGGPTGLSDGSAILSSSLPNGSVYDGSQRAFSDVNHGNAVDDNLNSSVDSMEADLGSEKAKLDSCKEDSLSPNPSRIQVAGTVTGHSNSSHDYDQCVTGVLDAQNLVLSTTEDSSAFVQDEMEEQLQEEAPKVDPAVTGAAEMLIQLLLAKSPSSSNCFTDVKHGSLEAQMN
ncbi:hypothetical protein QJS10_CPB11g00399 [Acorus calamus]|uniref:Uncharacterized protein n=1 Tax=Acorus calamus TaxID=4465 RepID=A0AAV9DW05_ACOCL|nr:hypothetical protein QJS10_CPB11g00399 [Acorus calamus]